MIGLIIVSSPSIDIPETNLEDFSQFTMEISRRGMVIVKRLEGEGESPKKLESMGTLFPPDSTFTETVRASTVCDGRRSASVAALDDAPSKTADDEEKIFEVPSRRRLDSLAEELTANDIFENPAASGWGEIPHWTI